MCLGNVSSNVPASEALVPISSHPRQETHQLPPGESGARDVFPLQANIFPNQIRRSNLLGWRGELAVHSRLLFRTHTPLGTDLSLIPLRT